MKPEAKLADTVDPVEKLARDACFESGIETFYSDQRKALEDLTIIAFVVVTLTTKHHDIVFDIAKR